MREESSKFEQSLSTPTLEVFSIARLVIFACPTDIIVLGHSAAYIKGPKLPRPIDGCRQPSLTGKIFAYVCRL